MLTWRHAAVALLVGAGTVTAAAGASSPASAAAVSATAQVVSLTNQARAKAGCRPVKVDKRLAAAAQKHSRDMVERRYFEHDSPDGHSFADRESAEGYPDPGGENIAYGQKTAREVVTDWMHSASHRRNILDCSFTRIGVGLDSRGMYWTQDFGR